MNLNLIKLFFILMVLLTACNQPKLSNSCDVFSKNYIETLLFKSIFSLRSPHCGIDFNPTISPPKPLYEGRDQLLTYIKNDGSSILTASNTACDGTETGGYSSCLHAGLMVSVELKGGIYPMNSCDGYTAKDNFDTLQFYCFVREGSGLVFVATSIQRGKFLGDLVEGSVPNLTFKPMKISVLQNGELIKESVESIFWKNKINLYPDAGGVLSESGTLYLLNRNAGSLPASHLTADSIGILFQSSNQISVSNTAPFFQFDGKFQYIEGEYHSAFTINPFIRIGINNRFQWVSNLRTVMGGAALQVRGSQGFYQYLSSSLFNNGNAILVTTSGLGSAVIKDNVFYSVFSGDVDGTEISVQAPDSGASILNLAFLDLTLYSSTDEAINSSTNTNNKISGIVWKDVVAAQSSNASLRISNGSNPSAYNGILFSNFVSANFAGPPGIDISSPYSNTNFNLVFENIAILKENDTAFTFSEVVGNYFTGAFKLGTGSTCNPITSNSGLNASCSPNNGSDFVLTTNVPKGESFVGSIFVDDKVNAYDNNGFSTTSYPSDAKYLKFETPYRSYNTYDPANQFTETNRGFCSSGCRIFDWSLKKTDPYLRNVNGCPDVTKPLTHVVGGSASTQEGCQLVLKGSKFVGSNTCHTYHLRNAREILGDGKGNENGLCESNEECLYTPNIASYQGHGSLKRAYQVAPNYCQDVSANANTELKAIKLYQYSENGN